MSIYAKKLNGKQRAALDRMESLCGLEPLYQEDLDNGEISFRELWDMNVQHLEDIMADITNTDLRGC